MKTCSILLLFGLLVSGSCFAVDVAQCSNPSGKSYFPYMGMMQLKDSGWSNDKITDGITTLTKTDNNEYDIRFVDSRKQIISSKEDGGKVIMLSRGEHDVSFMVIYTGMSAEIYTFVIDKSGKAEYTVATSKSGNGVMIAKTSIMRGDCQFVNLDLIK